jgi:pimeloyl-ACP methyl ester carboxylesterase
MTMTCDEVGPPGTPVICLPWFGTSRAMTRSAFQPAFDGTGVRQVYVDLPGHGDSAAVTPPTSEAVLEAVVALIEKRAAEPVLLAGCSYGGYLAAAVARRRPELVRGLLLVCPGVRRERELPQTMEVVAEPGWLDPAPADLREHLHHALGRRARHVVAALSRALASDPPGDEDYLDELQGGGGYFFGDDDVLTVFEGPVSVVTGRQDGIVGYADQLRRMSVYPHGTFVLRTRPGTTSRTSSLSCCGLSLWTGCTAAVSSRNRGSRADLEIGTRAPHGNHPGRDSRCEDVMVTGR